MSGIQQSIQEIIIPMSFWFTRDHTTPIPIIATIFGIKGNVSDEEYKEYIEYTKTIPDSKYDEDTIV